MTQRIVLFGASDRHNLGDLLLPHVASALLPGRDLVVAGLAERDLRRFGGHRVYALHRLAGEGAIRGAHLLHVGGEILTCTARQAAAMLLPHAELAATLAYVERRPDAERPWLQALLGIAAPMPYVAARDQLPGVGAILFGAVGGVALETLPHPWLDEVRARLAAADAVSVRDAATLGHLQSAGIAAALLPDPVVMVEALFGAAIRARAGWAPVVEVLAAFPRGYIAVQLAAEYGDDATLDIVARQLDVAVADTGFGIVLFRAGAAPWHDDLAMLARIGSRMASSAVRVFAALDVWDICALLAHGRACAGSSLHAGIVAAAFGVPAVGLARTGEAAARGKLAAYAATWEAPADAVVRPPWQLAEGIARALAGDAAGRDRRRRQRVTDYRAGFAQLARHLA